VDRYTNNVSEIIVLVVCSPHMECYDVEPGPWQWDYDDLRFESSDGLSNRIKMRNRDKIKITMIFLFLIKQTDALIS